MISLLTRIALLPLHAYRRWISPLIPPRCRFYPTCSTYAVGALHTHGLVKGTLLATWRLLRCNPWNYGGVDHVPERGRWIPDPWQPPADWAGHDDPWARTPMGMNGVFPDLPDDATNGLVNQTTPADAGQTQGVSHVPALPKEIAHVG